MIKTGAEGVNVFLGWYINGSKVAKHWTSKSRKCSQKKEQKVPKKRGKWVKNYKKDQKDVKRSIAYLFSRSQEQYFFY